ncbi:MAG TPA: hypothetical protein ENO11_02660, partial [Desulfobacteraceae bacterium]|nr:hypothetical protein [Desulfobacteraceae bacterium]
MLMNLRSLNDISLKWKLTIPFLFLAITGAILLFVVLYKFQDNLIHINEAKRLNNQYQFFLNDIEFKRNMAMGLAYLSAQNPEVAEAFAFRDRDRLIELLQPAYQTLHKDFDVQQFHFHTDHATSFLRLHALDCCGEQMESFRPMITEAFNTCNACSGIELGTFGFGIRGVVPVFYLGNLAGTVEIGLSIGKPFLDNFKNHYGADVALHVKDIGEGAENLKVLASTMEESVLADELLNRSFATGEQLIITGKQNGRDVAVIAGPIYSFSDKIEAVVEIVIDMGPSQAMLRHYGSMAAAIALLGFVLSFSYILAVSSLFSRRIGEVVKGAEEIADGKRDIRIEVKS